MTADQEARYGDLVAAVRRQTLELARSGIEPQAAARVIVAAIEARKPRTRYVIGRDAKIMVRLAAVLGDRRIDRLVARNLGLGKTSAA